MMKSHNVQLSVQTWFALLGLGLTFWFVINHTALLLELLWILFGAVLLSALLRPVTERLAGWQVPRGLTILGSYLVAGGLVFGMVRLLAPIVQVEIVQMRTVLPALAQQLLAAIPQRMNITADVTKLLNTQGDTLLLDALGIASGFSTLLLNLLLVSILAYFFTTMSNPTLPAVTQWLAPAQRRQLVAIGADSYQRLTRWVWIQFALSLYYGVSFIVGLLFLQVPFAITIGLLGGLLSLIPYLGVAFAALLAVLSILPIAPWSAIWVVLFIMAITIIGSHVIMPVFYGRAIGINAAVVLIALFVGAKLQGLLGILFAIPVVVIFNAVFANLAAPLPPLTDATPDLSDPPSI